MPAQPFSVHLCNWDQARAEARRIRELVFVREQGVPLALEMDDQDTHCDHALAFAEDGLAVGTGRLLPDGHIGRMAVLEAWRGKGVGALLLRALIEQARQRRHVSVRLNAQAHAAGFYRRYGFAVSGPEFMEAGLAHVPMQRDLATAPG
ncbi:MAG: GNAT family N-acetyltransferase [Betaproteobacteria bacterium]|nr:GNAT family N-acetyltransferase [Betaproteobacteria bacterium]